MKLFEIKDSGKSFDDEDEAGPNYEEIVPRLVAAAVANGGFTVNANTFDNPNLNDGYQVAIEDYETNASLDDIDLMIEAVQDINAFINQQSSTNLYVGGWIDNGDLCLDVSQYVQDYDEAMGLGRARKQKAIFDNANMVEIPCDGSDDMEIGDDEVDDVVDLDAEQDAFDNNEEEYDGFDDDFADPRDEDNIR